jgi:hypothetical protein
MSAVDLGQVEVDWRCSRRHVISVARRQAAGRLDEFVGPDY